METDALLQPHSDGNLADKAYDILESELKKRSVNISNGSTMEPKHDKKSRIRQHCALWAKSFGLIGVVVPIICLALNLKPLFLLRFCELCWPTGFLLLAMEGHFNLAIVLFSTALNAVLWAGLGWMIGYGTSNRIKDGSN